MPGVLEPTWSERRIPLPLICALILVSRSSSGVENPSAAASSLGISGGRADRRAQHLRLVLPCSGDMM